MRTTGSVRLAVTMVLALACGLSADSPAPMALSGTAPATQPAATSQPGPASRPAADDATAPVLRVASYNINYGNPNLKAVVANIRKADADIVVLQETTPAAQRNLVRNLARIYPVRLFRKAPAAGGFGFLARVPVKDVRYAGPIDGGWFGSYSLTAVHDGRDVRIVSIHLTPSIPPQRGGILAFWKEIHRTAEIREREIRALLRVLPQDVPALLAGDFNSIPLSKVRREILEAGLVDAMADSSDPTWSWLFGKSRLFLRLDYLFHSPALRSTDPAIIRADGSDHFLIHADFAWAPPAPPEDED